MVDYRHSDNPEPFTELRGELKNRESAEKANEREFIAIAAMIKHSEKEGLLPEVIWSLLHTVSPQIETETIESECQNAMYEWDI